MGKDITGILTESVSMLYRTVVSWVCTFTIGCTSSDNELPLIHNGLSSSSNWSSCLEEICECSLHDETVMISEDFVKFHIPI